MSARAEYRALRTIQMNGVNAYQAGDEVYASAVESLGLVVGEDVEPSGEQVIQQPAKNASRDKWAAYALDQGLAQEDVDDMGRDELVAYFDDEKSAEPVVVEPDED
jgi:hypothetical protein